MNDMINPKIEKGIPLPEMRRRVGVTKLMRSLKVGESFVIPRSSQGSIGWLSRGAGITVTSRKISDTEVRVWRIK